MIVDFVADFEVRCSKCHLSTHAYIKPEDAAKHWNDGDDIMDNPLHIFWDDPEGYLQGEVVSIHISDDGFTGNCHESCTFDEAIFKYNDKTYFFEFEEYDGSGTLNIGKLSSFDSQSYGQLIKPADGDTIRFDKIIYSGNGDIKGIAFRWNDAWLFVFVGEHELILTHSLIDLSNIGFFYLFV